jgi:DNA-binding transcriptional LysR family regulator
MELLRLRYFVALAETENLTQTASDLHISPSSLSLTITKLEKELGTPLFDRTGRKLQLNETGRELYSRLRNLLTDLDFALNKAMKKNTVSLIMGLPASWSSPLSEFARLKPEIHLSNRIVRRASIERELLTGDFDFWLTTSSGDEAFPNELSRTLNVRRLSSPALFLAVPETSELAKRESISFEELKDENFIFPLSTYTLYNTYMELCQSAGFEPKVIANCNFFVRMKMVATGLGVTFVDGDAKDSDLFKRIAFLKVTGTTQLPTRYICWQKKSKLSSAAQEFLNFITVFYQDA